MNVKIKIEQLILEGVSLSPSQQRRLLAAVETDLSHLLAARGLPPSLLSDSTIPRLQVNQNVTNTTNSTQLSQQIARSIYGGLTQ